MEYIGIKLGKDSGRYKKHVIKLCFGTILNLIDDFPNETEFDLSITNIAKTVFDRLYRIGKRKLVGGYISRKDLIDIDKNVMEYLDYHVPIDNTPLHHHAALNGYIDILKYMRDDGCDFDEKTIKRAIYGGHIESLIFLHRNRIQAPKKMYYYAINSGHAGCWKYMIENMWDVADNAVCQYAADNGNVEFLDCVYRQGTLSMKDLTHHKMLERDDVMMCKFFHERGYPKDILCEYAEFFRVRKCLDYLHRYAYKN